MFARITQTIVSVFLLFVVFAAAAPTEAPGGTNGNCNTGPVLCCNSVQSVANSQGLLGALGIVTGPITGLVGTTCSPVVGGGSCNAKSVCCTNNNFNGLIAIGCIPIIL